MPAERGCLFNSCLFLVVVCLPLVGQIILTLMVFEDEHSPVSTVLWLIVVWLLPFLGPLLYLLFGQRTSQRGRIMFAQPSYQST
jgi:Phospholipase_D-nuclease N-terminal